MAVEKATVDLRLPNRGSSIAWHCKSASAATGVRGENESYSGSAVGAKHTTHTTGSKLTVEYLVCRELLLRDATKPNSMISEGVQHNSAFDHDTSSSPFFTDITSKAKTRKFSFFVCTQ